MPTPLLPLSHDEVAAYERGLTESHAMRLRVEIHDPNEDPIGSLTAPVQRVMAGSQVDNDDSAQIRKLLRLEVADPKGRLDFDPHSPSESALYVGRFVSVVREDFIRELNDFVPCHVFYGPVWRYRWRRGFVSVEAGGKESLALEPNGIEETLNFGEGHLVVDVIRDLLKACGETKFRFPEGVKKKLPEKLSVPARHDVWKTCQRLAESIGFLLYYDAAGYAVLRKVREEPSFTFADGQNDDYPTLMNYDFAYDPDRVRNYIVGLGPKPDGKKKERLRAVARPDADHPLSPESLSRNGKKRFIVERIEFPHVKRQSELQDIVDQRLERRTRAALEVTCEVVPHPHAEIGLLAVLKADDRRVEFPLRKFTLPLAAKGGGMSINFLKRPRMDDRRRRNAHNKSRGGRR